MSASYHRTSPQVIKFLVILLSSSNNILDDSLMPYAFTDDKPENLDWNFDVFMPEADLAWTDSIEIPEFEPLPEFEELQMVEFEPLQLEWNIIEI